MVQTTQILGSIDHITEELAEVKKALLVMEIGEVEKSKRAWERIKKASQGVPWDEMSAVEEIRCQRGR